MNDVILSYNCITLYENNDLNFVTIYFINNSQINIMKTIKKLRVTIALKSILFILLLSWITILSSCTAVLPSRYDSNGVRIERQGRTDRQQRRNDRNDRRNDRNDRNNDRNDRNNPDNK